jgi:hypothetical protein
VNRAEIISKTLKVMNLIPLELQSLFSEQQDEEAFIVSVLQDVLPNGVDILTCEDFKHLRVACCETCHDYPHYDMSLICLPDGLAAWVCHCVEGAISLDQRKGRTHEEFDLKRTFSL